MDVLCTIPGMGPSQSWCLPTIYKTTKHHRDPRQYRFLPPRGRAASLKAPVSPPGNIPWRTKLDVKEQKDFSSG